MSDGPVGGVTMRLGVEEPSTVVGRFAFLYNNRVGPGPGIVPHPRDLPTDLLSGTAPRDREPVLANLVRNEQVRSGRSDRGELIAKIAVQRFQPIGKFDHNLAIGVANGDAVINILHLRRFNE